jgi:hypothetical protein
MQTNYELSSKQKREIFNKYSKQLNFDFYYSILDDIVDFKDAELLEKKDISQQKDSSFESLLKRIMTQ